MYKQLVEINSKPAPFEFHTTADLWTDPYRAKQMLSFHLDEESDIASRKRSKITAAVSWMTDYFHIALDTKICDFGCGPGLYTNELAKTGANVTGIDFSVSSLNYARETALKENLSINYIEADYLHFETSDQFDLISLIYYDYCALSPEHRIRLLKNFYRFLKPGGKIVLDVFSLNAFDQREASSSYEKNQLNGFWSGSDYFGFLNVFKYDGEKIILDKHSIIEENQIYTIYNWLQYFSVESLTEELVEAGFNVECLMDDLSGNPYTGKSTDIAVVACKV